LRCRRENWTYVEIKDLRTEDIVIDDPDIKASNILGDDLKQFCQLGAANTICTVDRELALDLLSPQSTDKRLRQLLVVSGLADLAVGLGGTLGVDAAGQVVQLGRGEDLEVGVLGVGSLEGVG
jgi:hypothetical protein